MKLLSNTSFNFTLLTPSDIEGFHGGVVEDSHLVECDTVSQGEWFQCCERQTS
jgi:hypothetical protein